jgi:secretion/DNA translocation related TadE-like protein
MTRRQHAGGAGGAGERGSGTVLAVGLVGVLASLLVAGLLVAAVATTGQRARTAADLAALAVAGQAVAGAASEVACATGEEVAARHGATVVSCTVAAAPEGLPQVEVAVSAPVQSTPWVARARASAGAVAAQS